jgi:hypothetical protein
VHGHCIGYGVYLGHELYDQNISSELVSVYIMSYNNKYTGLMNEPLYYSNNKFDQHNLVKWVDNAILSNGIKKQVIKNEYLDYIDKEDVKLYQYKYFDETYTFYSNGNINVFMEKTGKSTLVFFEKNAMIFDMTSTQFLKNSKPVFLLACGQPESDYTFNLTLMWDGKEFKAE